jgi:hypothetical protein
MAIKRWNASTSQWELVGTPGTATPSAIGAATLASTGNTFLGVQTITAASEWPLISRFTNPASTHRNHLLLQRSNNNAAVTSGFTLGGISMSGHDGTNYGLGWNGGAEITAYAAETWTPSARGTSLAFSNTASGTNSITERMRIQANGDLVLTNQPFDGLRYFDIYNTSSGNSAGTIIRLITNNAANSAVTSVDIVKYRTGGFVINNNDGFTSFNNSGAERMRIGSAGNIAIGSTNTGSHRLYIEDAQLLDTVRVWNTNASFGQHVMQTLASRGNNSGYYFNSAYSGGGGDAEFTVRGDGQVNADLSFTGGGADYAEYFEWADGNPSNEDRRGYSVSLINDKIKIAEEGEIVFGVVSGNPSVVGDDAPMKWAGKYLKDDFGSYIRDEDGYRVLNPEYDEEAEYVSRESRPEWSTIGLMGKLRLRKGQIVSPSWIKMKDISAEVEEWLVK